MAAKNPFPIASIARGAGVVMRRQWFLLLFVAPLVRWLPAQAEQLLWPTARAGFAGQCLQIASVLATVIFDATSAWLVMTTVLWDQSAAPARRRRDINEVCRQFGALLAIMLATHAPWMISQFLLAPYMVQVEHLSDESAQRIFKLMMTLGMVNMAWGACFWLVFRLWPRWSSKAATDGKTYCLRPRT